MFFEDLAACLRERKRYQQKHQKWNRHRSLNRYKIDVKTMLKKEMPKLWTTVRQLIHKCSQIDKHIPKIHPKINAKI